jgi:hypothetical protein
MKGYQQNIKEGSFKPVVHAMMLTGAVGIWMEHKVHVAHHAAHGDGHGDGH